MIKLQSESSRSPEMANGKADSGAPTGLVMQHAHR